MMRALVRQPEIGVRRALGASGGHIAAVLFAEGTVLVTLGGIIGAVASVGLVRALSQSKTIDLPRLDEVGVDLGVFAITATVLLIAVGLFTLVPFAIAMRADPQTVLRAGGRSGVGSRRQSTLRAAFVVAEVALAVVIATATGAVLESLIRLQRVRLGYDPSSVFMARLSLPPNRFPTVPALAAFADRFEQSLRSDPAVVEAGMISLAPLSGLMVVASYTIAGRPALPPGSNTSANLRQVTPDYLSTIGAEVIAGRGFRASDDAEAPPVVLISRALAERELANVDPIGQQIMIRDGTGGPHPVTVVGVVENLQHLALDAPPSLDIYLPLPQAHPDHAVFLANNQFWMVRVRGDVPGFGRAFLSHLQSTDPTAAVARMGPMADYVELSLAGRRVSVGALLAFALVSIVLATLGAYGVMAYGVEQRRREIGVRLVLGASPGDVIRLVVGQTAAIASLGVVFGLIGALAFQRALSGMLFGVSATDPRLLASVGLLLLLATVAAGWIPALRAARIDPATTVGGQ
jgi:putative ABC transport system permease protein